MASTGPWRTARAADCKSTSLATRSRLHRLGERRFLGCTSELGSMLPIFTWSVAPRLRDVCSSGNRPQARQGRSQLGRRLTRLAPSLRARPGLPSPGDTRLTCRSHSRAASGAPGVRDRSRCRRQSTSKRTAMSRQSTSSATAICDGEVAQPNGAALVGLGVGEVQPPAWKRRTKAGIEVPRWVVHQDDQPRRRSRCA